MMENDNSTKKESNKQKNHALSSLSHCAKAVKIDFSRYKHQPEKLQEITKAWHRVAQAAESEVIFLCGANGNTFWNLKEILSGGMAVHCRFFSTVSCNHKNNNNRLFAAISDALVNLIHQAISTSPLPHKQFFEISRALKETLGDDDQSQLFSAFPSVEQIIIILGMECSNGDNVSTTNSCWRSSSSLSSFQAQLLENESTTASPNNCSIQYLQVIVKKTIRVLASFQTKPILFLIEDLHMADPASLDLIKTLFSDQDSNNILYVATLDDDDEFHPTSSVVFDNKNSNNNNEMKTNSNPIINQIKQLDNLLPLTEISVGLMTESQVNQMVASVLDLTIEDTKDLAQVVFQKTGGMYFFAQQFIEFVHELDLLLYSLKTSRFEWDLDQIVAATDISDNMADLVVNRIERLDESRQFYLRIAACLGYQFKTDLVALLIEHEKQQQERQQLVDEGKHEHFFFHHHQRQHQRQGQQPRQEEEEEEEMSGHPNPDPNQPILSPSWIEEITYQYRQDLEALMDAGLLEKGLFGDTKFTHKRIQDAAYKLNPSGRDRELLHLRLGYFMFRLLDIPQYDGEIVYFGAIDQLNGGKALLTRREDKMFLIKQNMQAANVAKLRSAFKVSADYLFHALDLLDEGSCWKEDYDLCLELYTCCSECELNSGQNYEKCNFLVSKVLENGKCIQDTVRVCMVKVQLLGYEGKVEESIKFGVYVLRECGFNLPKGKSSEAKLIWQLIQTKRALRGFSDNDLVGFGGCGHGEHLRAELDLMNMVGYHAFRAGDKLLMSICCMIQIRSMLKHRISFRSSVCFCNFAICLLAAGDFSEACRFMEISLKVLDQATDADKTTILLLIYTFISHWKYPIRDSLNKLILAYELGMKSGNVPMAWLCPGSYFWVYFSSGLALNHVNNDMKRFIKDIKEYNLQSYHDWVAPGQQATLNLMGKSEDPCILTGEAMDEEELLQSCKESKNESTLAIIFRLKLYISVILGEYEAAFDCMSQIDKYKEPIKYSFFRGKEHFYRAVAFYATGAKRRARRHAQEINVWSTNGNPNCLHLQQILEAEGRASKKRKGICNNTVEKYGAGISTALRSGFIHDAALAHERCALYFRRHGDTYWSSHHLGEACKLYIRWNAFAKVKKMKELYPELAMQEEGDVTSSSTGIHEKARYNPKVLMQHKEMEFRSSFDTTN